MRESIGGTWLFGIVALFIVLFSGFLAYAISYTKAFKVKNEIINAIERNEGYTPYLKGDLTNKDIDDLKNDPSTEARAYAILKGLGYNTAKVDTCQQGTGIPREGGWCLKKICVDYVSGRPTKVYYKVTTFVKVTLPVVNVSLNIPITGETRILYFENPAVDNDFWCNVN